MEKENISNGDKLRLIRQSLKLGQVEIANILEIRQSYYSNLEAGKKNISSNVLNRLFKKLSVSPSWFFYDTGAMFSKIEVIAEINNSDIVVDDKTHILNSHSISPIGIKKNARRIDDDELSQKGITGGRDLRADYEANSVLSQIDFSKQILKANNLKEMDDAMSDIDQRISYIQSIINHYSLFNKTMNAYNLYYDKNMSLSELVKVYKEAILIEKNLYDILSPYIGVINEVYNKVKEFNELNDRIYCLDDLDFDAICADIEKNKNEHTK